MNGCGECSRGLRGLLRRKLGRCGACVRAAVALSLAAWAIAAAVAATTDSPPALLTTLAVACAFTALAAAHFIALVTRVASTPPLAPLPGPELHRRALLATALKAGGIAFGALLLGRVTEAAHAQLGRCLGLIQLREDETFEGEGCSRLGARGAAEEKAAARCNELLPCDHLDCASRERPFCITDAIIGERHTEQIEKADCPDRVGYKATVKLKACRCTCVQLV